MKGFTTLLRKGVYMSNKISGLLLIGLASLTAALVYGFNQLANAIKESASFIKAGGSLSVSETGLPLIPSLLILATVLIGVYMLKK